MENKNKLVDLGILTEDEASGVKRVSLVEEPAIELDFRYFGKQYSFVKPSGGESKDEFISRCIPVLIKEGKPDDQAAAICYSYWTEGFAEDTACPIATQDVATNLKNRQNAINVAHYGPLNPNLPNEAYWTAKGKQFNTTADAAKESRCGNCAFFVVTKAIEDCIAKGIGPEGGNPMDVIDAGQLGYCEAFDFKCASKRTCDAWVVGGPITLEGLKVSFDYDDTLSTARGKELANKAIADGDIVYVISARNNKEGIIRELYDDSTDSIIVPSDRIYATGSNKAKIEKIKELGIKKHYDNNIDVINELGTVGEKFEISTKITCFDCGWKWDLAEGGSDPYICHNCGADNTPIIEKFESYNDYPESAKNAAKRALEFRDSHPEVECGTAVGWARANQLAKGENISEETIARMASFARHLQYKDVPYTEGCGGLMVDAWGGQAGIEWASNKLKEVRGEDFDIDTAGLAPYVAPYIKKNGKAEKPITKAILMEDWSKDAYIVDTILALAAELGTKEADLAKLFAMEFSNPTAGGSGTSVSEVLNQGDKKLYLYKYEGGVGPNSRDFCVGMVALDNYYTKAQIQAMSDIAVNAGFGINGASTYSIWSFKGGPNCKHRWIQYLVTMPNGQIQIEVVKDAAGRAGQRPIDMPKQGYYSKAAFKFASEDQMILVGPAMVPDISIPRLDADGEKYFVRFSAETIKEICMKYFKEARTNDVNTDHEENSAGAYIYESWIVEDPLTDKANTVYGYDLPKGSWVVTMKVDDKATWARIKSGELRGFSIEGILMDLEELEAKKKFEDIIKIMRDK